MIKGFFIFLFLVGLVIWGLISLFTWLHKKMAGGFPDD
jgi:hypothetical protein